MEKTTLQAFEEAINEEYCKNQYDTNKNFLSRFAKASVVIHDNKQKELLKWFYGKLSIPISEETINKMYNLFQQSKDK